MKSFTQRNINVFSKVARSFSRIREDVPIIDLREENLRSLKDVLEKITWDSVLEKEDLNEGFEVFHNTFTTLYKALCFKEKTAKHGRKNTPIYPWVTESLLRFINKKNKLWADYRNRPRIASLDIYESYKKYPQSILREAK